MLNSYLLPFFDNGLHKSKKKRNLRLAITTNTSVMKKLDLLWTSLLTARFCGGGATI
jgi:hypothetical protein